MLSIPMVYGFSRHLGVIMKLNRTPLSLQIRCRLNSKNHHMEHLPLWAMPLNTL